MKLKYIFLWFFCSCFALSCGSESGGELSATELISNPNSASQTTYEGPEAKITFDQPEFDFGSIESGMKVEHEFTFTNTGDAQLLISNAKASCGCTVPNYPKEPIAPGKKGVITVVYDSKGNSGQQVKVVDVIANTNPSQTEIILKGRVTLPDEDKSK